MRNIVICLLAVLGLSLTVELATATPAGASVSNTCHKQQYANSLGQQTGFMATCDVGSAHASFQARTICNDGTWVYGVKQFQGGPWFVSTARCPGSALAITETILFT
jgi:hypothetical protein